MQRCCTLLLYESMYRIKIIIVIIIIIIIIIIIMYFSLWSESFLPQKKTRVGVNLRG